MNEPQRQKHQAVWDDAYKNAHVAAELTELHAKGKTVDAKWLLEVARALNCNAQQLEVIQRGGGPV